MPTIAQITMAQEADDAFANVGENTYTNAGSVYVGSLSGNEDRQAAWYFALGATIPRYSIVSEAPLLVWLNARPASNTIVVDFHLIKSGSPSMPTTVTGISGASRTTQKVSLDLSAAGPIASVPVLLSVDMSAVLNEILQTAAVSSVVILARDQNRTTTVNNRVTFRNFGWDTGSRPKFGQIVYAAPQAVTAQGTPTFGDFQTVGTAQVGSGAVTGEGVATFGAFQVLGEGEIGAPPPVNASGIVTFGDFLVIGRASEGDPTINNRFDVYRPSKDSHHFLTEDGELIGFTADYDTVIGGIRDAMMGLADDAWLPEAGTLTRVPASLPFTVRLLDRDAPKLDGDRMIRKLQSVRAILHPDGRILEVSDVLLRARPSNSVIEVTARPSGAILKTLLEQAVMPTVLYTEGSTPEIPVYAIDASAGMIAALPYDRLDAGAIGFGFRLEDRNFTPLVSLGAAPSSSGVQDPTSIALWWEGSNLNLSLRGVASRVREAALGPVLEPLVLYLLFGAKRATLISASSLGVRNINLEIGAPVAMNEPVLTAGVDSAGIGMGAFLAPGSSSLNIPLLSTAIPADIRAAEAAERYYRELARSDRSWAIIPPSYTLSLARADTKPMEMVPGESVQLDFAIVRGNNYTGGITAQVTPAEGINASFATLSDDGITRVIRVTFSAPAGTAETTYPFRIHAEATGASNPGSILADVRVDYDNQIDVAASAQVAPNATFLLTPNDPVQRRPEVALADQSGQGNAFSFSGYARIGRQGRSLLATGKYDASIYSGALVNNAQVMRMNAEMSLGVVFREVSKTTVSNGVMASLASSVTTGSIADEAAIIRVQGGFRIRTALAGVFTTSPELLPWTSGDAELMLRITASQVILTDRATMRSISMARPAWPDNGVRVSFGARRTPLGAIAEIARAHVLTAVAHPYALTDIQVRRTMDWLRSTIVASDGKPEWPDGMLIISHFNPNTTEQPSERLRNYGAPALNITWSAPNGGVTFPTVGTAPNQDGRVQTDGADSTVFTTGFLSAISSAEDYEVVAVVHNLAGTGTYNHVISGAASGDYNAYWGVGRDSSNRLMLRTFNPTNDLKASFVADGALTGRSVFVTTWRSGGRYLDLLDLLTGVTITGLDRGKAVTGQTSFSLGSSWAAGTNGAANPRVKFPGPVNASDFFVHRGRMTAQEKADLKTLLA